MNRNKFIELFVHEAQDHLAQIEEGLADWPPGPATRDRLRRAWHSLKGMSATMGYADLATLAHAAEDLMRALDGGSPANDMAAAARGVSGFLAALAKGEAPRDLGEVISSLGAVGSSTAPQAPATQDATPACLPASVRVGIRDLDDLLAEVFGLEATLSAPVTSDRGEARSSAAQARVERMRRASARLRRIVERLRLVPFSSIVPWLRTTVSQAAAELDRRARLEVDGGDRLVDRGALEFLLDPLTHVLRNAVAHGIESPEARRAAGKPEVGSIGIRLTSTPRHIVVSVTDDGAGVDPCTLAICLGLEVGQVRARLTGKEDLMDWLGRPGVSTASTAGTIAGRGMGLDAARAQLQRAGGGIAVRSRELQGTTVEIRISPRAQVTACLLASAGGALYGLPLASVSRAGAAGPGTRATGLDRLLGASPAGRPGRHVVTLDGGQGRRMEVAVDNLLGRLDCVVRPLPGRLGGGIYLGTAMTGDGALVAVLDPTCLASFCRLDLPLRDADRAAG